MEQALAPGSFPIHDFSPFLIRFSGDFGIRYYGLAYVLGFVVALALVVRAVQTGRTPLRKAQIEPFFIALLLGVIVGGRLGSVLLYNLDGFLEAPWIVFFVWEGGMASHGGFIGVCAAVLLFAHREKLSPFRLGDLVVMATPPGILFGRLANFINGELWGKPSTVRWAWIFPDAPYDPTAAGYFEPALQRMVNPRHPSQLYEAALEGVVLGAWVLGRFWGRRGMLPRAGQLTAEFLILYAVLRIAGEQFRARDAGHEAGIFDLSRGTFYSVLTLLVGLGLWGYLRWRETRKA